MLCLFHFFSSLTLIALRVTSSPVVESRTVGMAEQFPSTHFASETSCLCAVRGLKHGPSLVHLPLCYNDKTECNILVFLVQF